MKAQSLTQLHNKIFKSITAKVGFENEELGMLHSSRDNTQGLLPQLNVDFFLCFKAFIALFGDTQAPHTAQESMEKRIQPRQ